MEAEIAQLWRTILLASGGIATGLALAEARLYFVRWKAAKDGSPLGPLSESRLLGMMFVRMGIVGCSLYLIISIATVYNRPELSWRAPSATVVLMLLIVGMVRILRDDDAQIHQTYSGPKRRAEDAPPG